MQLKTINYNLDGQDITLTVQRATSLIGINRSILVYRAAERIREQPELSEGERVLLSISYPDMVSCTKSTAGLPNPVPFEQFCNLPDDLFNLWEQAVYEVNPHWNPAGRVEDREKKE